MAKQQEYRLISDHPEDIGAVTLSPGDSVKLAADADANAARLIEEGKLIPINEPVADEKSEGKGDPK